MQPIWSGGCRHPVVAAQPDLGLDGAPRGLECSKIPVAAVPVVPEIAGLRPTTARTASVASRQSKRFWCLGSG